MAAVKRRAGKAKPKAPKPKPRSRPKPKGSGGQGGAGGTNAANSAISVRMYRVGFGDCFLVSLPVDGSGPRHILVDCGVHAKGDIGTIDKVVADIAATTDGTLAVVIATHAHQDHIAGFDRFSDTFTKFKIGEVWLPWTWDPANPQAVKLQGKQAALAGGLAKHFAGLGAAAAQRPLTAAAADAVGNLRGNPHAIALLKSGFGVGATVRYLKAEDSLIDPAGIAGLTVKVLGPPQSEEYLQQMDPPSNEAYLRFATGDAKNAGPIEPFFVRWRVEARAMGDLGLSQADVKRLGDATDTSAEDLAFALDKARNNESVVALLTYRGQSLLFAGDAQYGNWRWWLEHDMPDQILPQIRFLKVAHHGSVNATPKDALEKMTDGGFAAMVSTQGTPWPSIPRAPLMARIDTKTKHEIVRSDWLAVAGASGPGAGTAPAEPSQPPAGFTEGVLWFDYVLKP